MPKHWGYNEPHGVTIMIDFFLRGINEQKSHSQTIEKKTIEIIEPWHPPWQMMVNMKFCRHAIDGGKKHTCLSPEAQIRHLMGEIGNVKKREKDETSK